MSRSRDLANLAGDATGLETLTVSDITDLTATATELNKLDGVTSAVQTQLNQLDSQTSPHIIPGVLYPAVGGKLLDGITSHSGNYGTAQTQTGGDGKSYYYTDIKGSKPIKDPRIGGHFGSQRYKFKSLQLLEQETATHGKNVYSVDGREWVRTFAETAGTDMIIHNDGRGQGIRANTASMAFVIEIVGYFSEANILAYQSATTHLDDCDCFIDGTSVSTGQNYGTSINTPLEGRHVDCYSVRNLDLGSTTLGLHTLKFHSENTGGNGGDFGGIELIAQDTTSTANRSKIQIPSQDVVSYGKKFTVSGTPHYNPFNNQTIGDTTNHGKNTTGWTTYDSTLDTETSLGLDAWVDSGNYYRPVNGGRVVKWVDSSGNIKTSVNMMPPSAKAIGSHSGNSGPHQTAWTSTYQPVFSSGSVDHTQAEVAKTFHWREFGNGSANGGTGSASYADASMLNAQDDIAYVMDDGLTSLSGDDVAVGENHIFPDNVSDFIYLTFIGTGIHLKSDHSSYKFNSTIAQNLPYGTHILKIFRDDDTNPDYIIDGVSINDISNGSYGNFNEVTFYQPKRPPIPEDACVISDYMLMADFVQNTSTNTLNSISKGVRVISGSRDVFYNGSGAFSTNVVLSVTNFLGFKGITSGGSATALAKIPFFGTNAIAHAYNTANAGFTIDVNSSTNVSHTDYSSGGHNDTIVPSSAQNLGLNTVQLNIPAGGFNFQGYEAITPIHTSSHYQSFETPFLHELVGGDRNMEQTNLVVSPDGKSWDEVTRDVSYIGHEMFKIDTSNGNASSSAYVIFNKFRGQNEGSDLTQKNFAIGYDRFICLRDGMYEIYASTMKNINTTYHANIWVNETRRKSGHSTNINHDTITNILTTHLKRGDYVRIEGGWYASAAYSHFHIIRLEK